jgi:hypothetical protein
MITGVRTGYIPHQRTEDIPVTGFEPSGRAEGAVLHASRRTKVDLRGSRHRRAAASVPRLALAASHALPCSSQTMMTGALNEEHAFPRGVA